MPIHRFKTALDNLKYSLNTVISNKIDISKPIDKTKAMYSFKEKRAGQIITNITMQVADVKKFGWQLSELNNHDPSNADMVNKICINIKFLDEYATQPEKAIPILEELNRQMLQLNIPTETQSVKSLSFKTPKFPEDIRLEIIADIDEIKRCFDAECYRSGVILCGRVLETALHRKYFEITGNDILEKNPGIGLGTLIGKLKDRNVTFDPGLTQQIHLINQARIFSVHKKQEPFNPSKAQTQAIILYTMDVLWKMF